MCAIKLQIFPQVEPSKIGNDGLSSVLLETSHGSDDALRRNVNRNVRTVFCIIEIAEVVSSLAELEYNP